MGCRKSSRAIGIDYRSFSGSHSCLRLARSRYSHDPIWSRDLSYELDIYQNWRPKIVKGVPSRTKGSDDWHYIPIQLAHDPLLQCCVDMKIPHTSRYRIFLDMHHISYLFGIFYFCSDSVIGRSIGSLDVCHFPVAPSPALGR